MPIALLIKSVMGLLGILAILFFLFFLSLKSKKNVKKKLQKKKKIEEENSGTNIHYLRSIIKNKESTTKELQEALDLIILHHGTISKEKNIKSLADFDVYMEIIFKICRHPNTTKNLIVKFSMELEKRNPEFKKEINDIMLKGLNSRIH